MGYIWQAMKKEVPGKNTGRSRWEVRPDRFRFYYGYIVVLAGTLGVWLSIPGQTIGVSVFTDPVKDALGLSRSEFSYAYALGTIASSFLLGRAGKWFDRYGARKVAFGAVLGLSLSIALFSFSEIINRELLSRLGLAGEVVRWGGSSFPMQTLVTFGLVSLFFFMIRFCGQGILTMSSRNMIMIWFEENRGKVNAFTSVALSFGFSSAPIWLNGLVDAWGWDWAWRWMALGLLGASLIVWSFYRDRPEEFGLLPDGRKQKGELMEGTRFVSLSRQFTLKEARRTRAFWIYAFILAFNSFFITGLTFHVVSIFGSVGWEKDKAISLFLPGSVVSVSVSTLFNFLSDYVSLKRYLYLMITGGMLASTGLYLLDTDYGYLLLIGGIGLLGGFFSVLNSIVWPRFYGRTHLGAISGRVASFLVFSSALAPSMFSWVYSHFDTYQYMSVPCMAVLIVLAIGGAKANNPQPKEFRKKFE